MTVGMTSAGRICIASTLTEVLEMAAETDKWPPITRRFSQAHMAEDGMAQLFYELSYWKGKR